MPLVDGNALFQQLFKGFGFLEVQQCFLDFVVEALIEHGTLGFMVEIEGRNDLLEFGGVRSDRFGLRNVAQSIPILLLEITVGVQGV